MTTSKKGRNLSRLIHLFIVLIAFGIIALLVKTGFTKENLYILAMIASGLGALYFSGSLYKYMKTSSWKKTQATIVDSKLKTVEASADSDAYYEPVIHYKYSDGLKEYMSGNVYPFGAYQGTGVESAAQKIVNKYQKGMVVPVHYNPSRHDESFLLREGNVPRLIFLMMCIVIFVSMIMAFMGIIDLEIFGR